MPPDGQAAGSSEPVIRSGLYIVRSFVSTSEEQAYVVYWPEETSWEDHAASSVQRNRVTFMRYSQSPYHLPFLTDRIHQIPEQIMRPVVLFTVKGTFKGNCMG